MAVLNRDEFFSAVNDIIGTSTDDASVQFLENMSDTFNAMENKANEDGSNWEQKYKELDESWKKKYTSRFFSGSGRSNIPSSSSTNMQTNTEDDVTPDNIKIDDLFEPANDKKE